MKVFQVTGEAVGFTKEAGHELTTPTRMKKRFQRRVISMSRMSKAAMDAHAMGTEWYVRDDEAPKTYAECLQRGLGTVSPCPFVGCSNHLSLDVTEIGSIRLNFPDRELGELPATCLQAVVRRGPMTLDAIGEHLSVTRERSRQLVRKALASLLGAFLRRKPAEIEALLRQAAKKDTRQQSRERERYRARSALAKMIEDIARVSPESEETLRLLPQMILAARARPEERVKPATVPAKNRPAPVRCTPYVPQTPMNPMLDHRRYKQVGS